MKLVPAILFSISAQVAALRAATPAVPEITPPDLNDGKPFSTVYFTTKITPESLVRIFEVLGVTPSATDKVAVKISTGEAGGHNYLKPELISNLVAKVNGTIVECNTAYRGHRNSSEEHWKTIRDHGFTDIAKVELLDEHGEIEIPVRDKSHIKADLVGAGITNYTFMVNLAHFKGHAMGGFGGVLKNQSIGVASSNGKARIHSAGATDSPDNLWSKLPEQDAFLESMAAAAQGVHDYFGNGKIVYINVLNNLSVDCDCSSHPAAPKMKDIGIMASLDPVALDQACVDMVTHVPVSDGDDNRDLLKRIAARHGTHIIDHAEKIGLGSRKYTLVHVGWLEHPEYISSLIFMTMDSAIGMVRRGEAACVVMVSNKQFVNGAPLLYRTIGRGRGIAPLLDIYESYTRSKNQDFKELATEEKLESVKPGKPFEGNTLVDKVIGRAAAFIAIAGGFKTVHGEIMCEGAKTLLEKHGVNVSYTLLVPQIRDRSLGHLCPLEDSVEDITDVDKAMVAIKARVAALRAGEKIETPSIPPSPRKLVAYYSRGGNTRLVAETIAHAVGADIFEIRPFAPYPGEYEACLDTAKADIAARARPALSVWPVDFSGYDTVFVGSPVWCGTIAPPVATFLSAADIKGKKIIPFFTHGGGGAGKAAGDFRARLPGMEIAPPGAWNGSDAKTNSAAIEKWAVEN